MNNSIEFSQFARRYFVSPVGRNFASPVSRNQFYSLAKRNFFSRRENSMEFSCARIRISYKQFNFLAKNFAAWN